MSERESVKPGDEVRVFDINGARLGQPAGGWPGKVTKVGRKLVTIAYERGTDAFRLDTRAQNDAYGHRHFKTLEQAALDERRDNAVTLLAKRKIRLDHGQGLTLEQIEALADLVRTFEDAS